MGSPQDQAQAVKTAIASGNATTSTVTTLQSLLSAEPKTKDFAKTKTIQPGKRPASAAKVTAKSAKTGSRARTGTEPIEIHKDGNQLLAPKERYSLATEVVNITLKQLADALKSRPKLGSTQSSDHTNTQSTPVTPRQLGRTASSASQRALQPRSENASPQKVRCGEEKPSRQITTAITGPVPHVLHTGECSRLAFSFLRSVNTKQLGVRELPPLQLENGMLALVGKLMSHGLDSLAIKELRILKGRLEAVGKPKPAGPPEKETLAGLLHLKADFEQQRSALPLAITYQSLVLRAITSSSKPATIEASAELLDPSQPSSPIKLIEFQNAVHDDKAKTGRLLEALSSTILGMCPSLSSKADATAVNREICPAPEAVIRLQSLGLRIRKQWWEMVGHEADLEREIFDPVLRCISAFIRRSRERRSPSQIYETVNNCFGDIISDNGSKDSKALLLIQRTLSSLAEEAGEDAHARKWSNALAEQCETLETNHAQRIAAVVKRVARLDTKESPVLIGELLEGLQSKMCGSTSDYEFLLAELSRLHKKPPSSFEDLDQFQKLTSLSVAFALRFVRSYPGQGLSAARCIIHSALQRSTSSESSISWINNETIEILIQTGALATITPPVACKPSRFAWASSSDGIILERALRLLMTRTLTSGSDRDFANFYDDKALGNLERGLLLECQLKIATEYAAKSRHHKILRSLLPKLIQQLHEVYAPSEHPLRRANLAVHVLRMCDEHPNLFPTDFASDWVETPFNLEKLAKDEGLREYALDVEAAFTLAKVLNKGNPSMRNLQPVLKTWQGLLYGISSHTELEEKVFEPETLTMSLRSIASFFGSLGEDTHRLPVLSLISKIIACQPPNSTESVEASVQIAKQWLSLGFSEKAGSVLAQSEAQAASASTATLTKIEWHLAYAEYLLSIDNLDRCKSSLQAAASLRNDLQPKGVQRAQRGAYERAHGEGWLVQSLYKLACGEPHESLAAAKHAVKIVNSAWCRLEKGQTPDASQVEEEVAEPAENEVTKLTTGVSKLRLSPKDGAKVAPTATKGAAFWPLVPLLCKSLTHLSDMYAHHGLFSEANYYSCKAAETAESVGSSVLLSRIRSHRAVFLSLAGKVEEAELCLVSSEATDLCSTPLASVERLQAQAAVRVKDGSPEEAAEHYDEALELLSNTETECFKSKMESLCGPIETDGPASRPAKASSIAPAKTGRSTAPSGKTGKKTTQVPKKSSPQSKKVVHDEALPYLLQKRKAIIVFHRAMLGVEEGKGEKEISEGIAPMTAASWKLKERHTHYSRLMATATKEMQTDFAYNILLDSTLSFPALLRPAERDSKTETAPASKKAMSTKPKGRAGPRKTTAKSSFKDTLIEARNCLLSGHTSISHHLSTAETHNEAGKLLDVSILCSSVDGTAVEANPFPTQAALALDSSRINALNFERTASIVDASHEHRNTPFEWPTFEASTHEPQLNTATFQEEYINTIPKPWTAISLYLDEACTSLYVARYRANHTPFILRLPFSRHQDEEIGDEVFDYAAGKEELREIIQLSNASCHSNGDLSAKGAKSNWWNEREALDRRLQELLINVEEMWFGGFKGVFSPRVRQPELLARFRASFEAALDRHLPSRSAAKGRGAKLALDHNVLELFINLGSDNDGIIDLDEPISDLLYFVVDMLQFNGERNAYDEVDFDEMTVEVLDALRSYHEASEAQDDESQHIVLVLDKRLQAFPWENLPCLEGISVSRVGSMLSLRDCIGSMRAQIDAEGRHLVSRKSGAYILNPSSDLTSTQTVLEPALSKAAAVDGAGWSSVVNKAPSEDDFKAALEKAAMTLYFGHGAGSQYIRPRAIKKLESCSEVVWLMGCSSGAVTEYGELEPQAVPLAYLNAGYRSASAASQEDLEQKSRCLAVVATLWDVTDKDIDRFSLTVGEEWGLWAPPAEPSKLSSKTPKKRERLVAPSTPQQVPKTPKTPRTKKTPGGAKTPARSRSRSKAKDQNSQASLPGAVAKSRDACYLRYLNGAAPVVYGVPVYLGD